MIGINGRAKLLDIRMEMHYTLLKPAFSNEKLLCVVVQSFNYKKVLDQAGNQNT